MRPARTAARAGRELGGVGSREGLAPPGTRAVDLLAAGALLISLSKPTTLLKTGVGVLQTWTANRPVRTVELTVGGNTLKVSGIGSEEQQRLIDVLVDRSAAS